MFVHFVAFWLKADLPGEKREALVAALEGLKDIETIRGIHVGKPPKSTRPIVDDSFDVGLCVLFDDIGGQETYQVHPLHLTFIEDFHDCWDRVQVSDFG